MKEIIINNLYEKFSFLPSNIPSMTVKHVGPLTTINSYLATDMFNIIYINKGAIPNPDEIAEAINIFKIDRLPFAFWLAPDEEKRISKILKQYYLNCTEEEYGMCIDLNNLQDTATINQALQIEVVNSDTLLLDWMQVFCALLPDECTAITKFYKLADSIIQKNNNKIKCYVGYLNNQPVATCALFFSENIAGIFDMITIPTAQRKGVATTMILYALNIAKLTGFQQVSLGASEEGKHVYKKLGFETYCQFKIYNPSYE